MTFVQNKREEDRASAVQWHIAVYVRLSKEDGDKLESDSIQNQKRIIEQHIQYLRDQGEMIASVSVYSDDGYPGGEKFYRAGESLPPCRFLHSPAETPPAF